MSVSNMLVPEVGDRVRLHRSEAGLNTDRCLSFGQSVLRGIPSTLGTPVSPMCFVPARRQSNDSDRTHMQAPRGHREMPKGGETRFW